jgi:hypothetical protein
MKVFDVYEKASPMRGLWGVSLKANMATVVDCKDDQANVREVEASKIPTLLASKLKAGYRRVHGAYFFSEKDGQLRREHPDFAGLHLEDVVLTARPPEVLAAVSFAASGRRRQERQGLDGPARLQRQHHCCDDGITSVRIDVGAGSARARMAADSYASVGHDTQCSTLCRSSCLE